MKNIISGRKDILLTKDILFVNVPKYDELKPETVLNHFALECKQKLLWDKILNYCPELKYTRKPKDRTFFYNILNTLYPKCINRLVYNAMKNR